MTDEHNETKIVKRDGTGEEYEATLLTTLKKKTTSHGFGRFDFKDMYGKSCSLQDSSLATESAIWFGVDDPEPAILSKEGVGWVRYPIHEDVLLHTRMHLTQDQVKALLPILTYFAETGEYIRDYEGDL